MRSASSLAAILVLAGLAGCLGGAEEDAPPVDPAAQDVGANATGNVTNDDGSSEMATDLGHMPHLHDYWKDRERVTLMDEDVTVDGMNAVFWTFVDTMRGTPGVGGAVVRLPDGQIVFEGTGRLEFTATWSEPTVTGMGVGYRTPADSQFSKTTEVKSGVPLVVEVTPETTDMPHAKTSRWQFLVMPAQAGQAIVGKFHVKVDIVRMGDIMLFPGHPELFGDASTLEIFKGSGTSNQDNLAIMIANRLQNKPDQDGVMAQKVVPMETQSMTANLTIKAATSDLGKASKVYLLVKPADRNGYAFVEAVAKDESKQLYQFAWLVEMSSTDSPYAKESDWKFDVFVTTNQGGVVEQCGACSNVRVEYDLEIVAYDAPVPDAKELRFGRGGGR